MNLGDGYELTYGQLTDLTVAEGDVVTTGEIIGKVAELPNITAWKAAMFISS